MNREITVRERVDHLEAEVAYWRERYEELAGLRIEAPIEGLTMQQTRLVHVLRRAKGRVVPYEALADAIGTLGETPPPALLQSIRTHMRGRSGRGDIAACIETVRTVGMRWSGPLTDETNNQQRRGA